jgi:hypothetical protein
MTGFRLKVGKPVRTIALQAGCAVALFCVTLWAPNAYAYPMYDDGSGNGCVQCHNQFKGGNGVLHLQHRTLFGITSCNLCHPSGGGSTPVLTYWSGTGGGFGCAGCHGQDYGETSPNSGQPKATAYGLRQVHVNLGFTSCGTTSCHQPGNLGFPNPFPTLFGEHVPPPYYNPTFSSLTDPCSSTQEDIPFDANTVGLDNDGNGVADWPADPDCPAPPTPTETPTPLPSPTPTPTSSFHCGAVPAGGCIAPRKGVLVVNEKAAGKEKLKVALTGLQPTVAPNQFGDPVAGSTAYKVCVYGAANELSGEYTVERAGAMCGDAPCWSTVSGKGYKYRDKSTATDGILKINAFGGNPGKGKVVVVGKNKASTLPTGVAAALQNQTSATVQVLTSDAACFGATLTHVKRADGALFKAVGP